MNDREHERERIRGRMVVNSVTGCWRWVGASRGVGYGAIKVGGRVLDAHRYSWMVFHGEIPDGLHVLHKCDNRACVNPDHLELGDAKKNRADAIARGAFDATAAARRRGLPLPKTKVARICRRYDGGESLRQLSREYGIPPTTLRRVVTAAGRRLPGESAVGAEGNPQEPTR